MMKKLKSWGNSVALVLDRPILDAVKLDGDSEVEVSTNGDVIVISPVRDKKRTARFRASYEAVAREYSLAFARLAK